VCVCECVYVCVFCCVEIKSLVVLFHFFPIGVVCSVALFGRLPKRGVTGSNKALSLVSPCIVVFAAIINRSCW
jgi:hypothetical protein